MTRKTKSMDVKREKPDHDKSFSLQDSRVSMPQLRFPEFREQPRWTASPLSELGAIVTGKTPSTGEDALWGGEILFITPTDIAEDKKYQRTTQRTVVETRGTKVLPAGSVVYTCIASIGKMALTVVPSVTNQQINSVVPNGKTAKEYVFYALAKLSPWIKSIPATSTLPIINKSQFSGFMIPHPENKAEQQKIAECLSSLDELMAAQARKVDALKTHKKGLMQQLFPREGETQPRLRFPEFQTVREWEPKNLAELSESISSGKDKASIDGAFHLYGSTGIIGKTHDCSYDGSFILVARVGANAGLLTRAVGKFGVTDNTLVITLKANQNIDFVVYYLDQLGLNRMVFGSGQPLITGGQLKALNLQLPKPTEQQRIASCLSTLDSQITAETQKLEALKTHKKGLMQQLFPSPEEVVA